VPQLPSPPQNTVAAQSESVSPQAATELPQPLQERPAETSATIQEISEAAAPTAKVAPDDNLKLEADASRLPARVAAQPTQEIISSTPVLPAATDATIMILSAGVASAAVLAPIRPTAGSKAANGDAATVSGSRAANPVPSATVLQGSDASFVPSVQSADDGGKTNADAAKDGAKHLPADQTSIAANHSAAASSTSAGTASAPLQVTPAIVSGQPPASPLQAAVQHTAMLPAEIRVAPHPDSELVSTTDKLGLAIAAKSIDGVRQFDIRLDPPELGRVQVQLSVDDSGKAHANLVVDKPQTLELLQRDAANLNRTLTDAGLNLPNNGLNFTLREQYRQNDGGGVDKGRGRALSVTAVVQTDANLTQTSIGSFAPHSVRLDIRV
jgi:flagellar hook-length control protein FliK